MWSPPRRPSQRSRCLRPTRRHPHPHRRRIHRRPMQHQLDGSGCGCDRPWTRGGADGPIRCRRHPGPTGHQRRRHQNRAGGHGPHHPTCSHRPRHQIPTHRTGRPRPLPPDLRRSEAGSSEIPQQRTRPSRSLALRSPWDPPSAMPDSPRPRCSRSLLRATSTSSSAGPGGVPMRCLSCGRSLLMTHALPRASSRRPRVSPRGAPPGRRRPASIGWFAAPDPLPIQGRARR